MAANEGPICVTPRHTNLIGIKLFRFINPKKIIFRLITFGVLLGLWYLAAESYNSELLLPTPWTTAIAFWGGIQDLELLRNLLLTLQRVLTGFAIAMLIGMPLGFLMGYSKMVMELIDPIVGTVRQVPIMAWIPLTIVWFGLGDGPTIFLIAMCGVFPILLNTVAGVQGISRDYYNAARSMGAGRWSIFVHVIVPGSLPDILTGMRLSLGSGWMSVICAEFIATSAGFGFAMVDAQIKMDTPLLIALMIMGALVGY